MTTTEIPAELPTDYRQLQALAKALEDLLDDEAAELDTADRARIEGVLRGLDRRAREILRTDPAVAPVRLYFRLGRMSPDLFSPIPPGSLPTLTDELGPVAA